MKISRQHFVFWFFYFWYCFLTDFVLEGLTSVLFEVILFLTHNILLFYGFYFCLREYSIETKKKKITGALYFLFVLCTFVAIRYTDFLFILPATVDPRYKDFDRAHMIVRTVMWIVMYFFYASAYFYFTSYRQKQRSLLLMEQEKFRKNKEQLELENELLKAQINPHFLYNALNFLYAKSLSFSEELSDGIMRLSDIMRYSLKPHDKDGLVRLNEEIAHIQNVVGMAQLRFNNKVYIDFTIKGDVTDEAIIPFVLITLVENILKHGTINQEQHPVKITLEIVPGKELKFSAWNKKRIGPKEKSTSIGLSNTIKRLEYAYGKDCTFEVTDNAEDFDVKLSMPLATQTTVA